MGKSQRPDPHKALLATKTKEILMFLHNTRSNGSRRKAELTIQDRYAIADAVWVYCGKKLFDTKKLDRLDMRQMISTAEQTILGDKKKRRVRH
jgi:hypothetical protein